MRQQRKYNASNVHVLSTQVEEASIGLVLVQLAIRI